MTEEQVFLAALDLAEPAERTAYLAKACGGDAEFRRHVEELLAAHFKPGAFLDEPVAEQMAASSGTPGDHTISLQINRGEAVVAVEKKTEEQPNDLAFLQPSTRPDSLGRIGHYEVLEVLGQGGFGIVLRAFDETLQRVVALKVLAPAIAATSPARKRFLREARASAQVRHENVVDVHAVEEQPLPYLVMEFIPGETLQARLDATGPLEAPEIVRIGRQIAEGLAAAHANDLIHRDIKPGNILLDAGQGRVKITDFGLARAADDASLTQSGVLSGTPLYMAPEQAKGEALDHRADLFSLGSVLYVMATGRPPFRAATTYAVLKRVVEDDPRPIREIIPEVPQWLCDLISRLHAKKPADRFASAQEVADLLTHHLAQLQHPGSVPAPQVAAPTPSPFPLPPGGRGKGEGAAAKVPPTDEIPAAAPALRPRFRTRWWVVAAAVLLMLLGGLGFTEATGVTHVRGTVIRLFSPEGTLVVEVDDPGVSIKIDGSDVVITGAGAKEIRLKPGRYTVEASKNGKVVSRELVAVTNNGRQVVRVSQEATPPDAKAAKPAAETTAWERSVAALPADEQVKAVGARLKQLNPGFDGKIEATIENDVVTKLVFPTDHVSDISPVRVLTRLRSLNCSGSWVDRGQLSARALLPLRGLPLTNLNCRFSPTVSDLSSLKGMKLTSLVFTQANVGDADVKNLAGMKDLQILSLWATKVTDVGLKELAGLKNLQQLSLQSTGVTDVGLKELAGLNKLEILDLYAVPQVTDAGLEELAGLKALKHLNLLGTSVTDAGAMKLASVLQSLRIVASGGRVIEPKVGFAPFPDADVKRIAALPAAEQVEEVRKELKRRNPDFEGALTPTIENDVVTGLTFSTEQVSDVSPVRALTNLKNLKCTQGKLIDLSPLKGLKLATLDLSGTQVADLAPLQGMPLTSLRLHTCRQIRDLTPLQGMPLTYLSIHDGPKVVDFSPLQGMPLTRLSAGGNPVRDLSPLKGLPLTELILSHCHQVEDLSPLKGLPLTWLTLDDTPVRDLEPLKDMPLKKLYIDRSGVTDLTPLQAMQLEDIRLTPKNITQGLDILRAMKSLKTIGLSYALAWPAAEFWDRHDKGEFKD